MNSTDAEGHRIPDCGVDSQVGAGSTTEPEQLVFVELLISAVGWPKTHDPQHVYAGHFLLVAPTGSVFRSAPTKHDGWRTSTGRIYVRCIHGLHKERTPSLVLYPKSPTREAHFRCYGCGMSGGPTALARLFDPSLVFPVATTLARVFMVPHQERRSGEPDNRRHEADESNRSDLTSTNTQITT